jgi:hypothetical protein
MPIPEEFVKKRTEVTISRATLKNINCQQCGASIDPKDIRGGFAKCGYCGHLYRLDVEGNPGA